jgi:hypothetical protein
VSRLSRVLLTVAVVLAGLPALTAASQAPDRSEHQRIIDFWTVERVREAVPRDFVFDPATRGFRLLHHRPDHAGGPGGGGGGGGNGDGDEPKVTGASWTGGGAVVDTTGKVLFELSGTLYVCSASVVQDGASGQPVVLTAAHCLYDNAGSGKFSDNWMFIPNYEAAPEPLDGEGNFCESTELGCWTADALVVHDGFASAGGFNATAIQYDFAFAVVGPGGHHNKTLAEAFDAPQAIMFTDVSRNTHVHAFGYPHASPYDGAKLTYCAGGAAFDNRLANLTYRLECDMTGGSSGGPWGLQFGDGSGILMSVNSYRYLGGNSMYGPKFNSNTAALYAAAQEATEDTVVK